MPEGPEVKTLTQQLCSKLLCQQLYEIRVVGGRFLKSPPVGLQAIRPFLPAPLSVIACKGKFIYWQIGGGWSMWNTLGMTGHWSFESEEHTALELETSNGTVYFSDIRRFGTAQFHPANDLEKKLNSIGRDMLSEPPTAEEFWQILRKPKNQTLAEFVMNQKYISGVGNYIKAEALYRAKLSPWRKTQELSRGEAETLRQAIMEVMTTSYQMQGATLSNYKDLQGNKGGFVDLLQVYKKVTDPVGNSVKREDTLDKRTTWWVPEVQK